MMIERMKDLKPLVACFNGKGIYEIFSGGKCTVGLQEQPLPGTETVSKLRGQFFTLLKDLGISTLGGGSSFSQRVKTQDYCGKGFVVASQSGSDVW